MPEKIINENNLHEILAKTKNPSRQVIFEIFKKAKAKKGLDLIDVGYLINLKDPALVKKLFKTAAWIKNEIYGERLVFFAPLYISDYCVNNCCYCNFHCGNNNLKRRKLSLDEIEEQVKFLINSGHKRVLLECGEDPKNNDIDYVVNAIKKIYSVHTKKGEIRRINVNIAATTKENYRKLKRTNIGTYQLFQETYHQKTYELLHKGPKADYMRQLNAHSRALEAGLDDVGVGVLFGLYDWRFEVLALLAHAQYLDKKYRIGPHTISVPRLQPATEVRYKSRFSVSDRDFLKIVAILRIAVPYTGLILSTRESAALRKKAFHIGISQASAGSRTTTGGYGKNEEQPQFKVQDERNLEQVIQDVVKDGFLPSFCTACYRKGRTGEAFMELSKPGEIHKFCRANGLLTFAEYMQDFLTNGMRKKGEELIEFYLNKIEDKGLRQKTKERLVQIYKGKRDLYF